MAAPSSPRLFSVAPTAMPATSFSSVTDPTIHRLGWRSPRAPDAPIRPSRKLTTRFGSMLRYDLLGPPNVSRPASPHRAATAPATALAAPSSRPYPSPSPAAAAATADAVAALRATNLEELKWFQHRWLDKHGKNSHLKELREKMALLRRWFESLDADGSGAVGVNELEDPLVSVGLARTRDEVQHLIDDVDKDGSGEVTFDEFLTLMSPTKPKSRRAAAARRRAPLHHAKSRVLADRARDAQAKAKALAQAQAQAQAQAHARGPGQTRRGSPRHRRRRSSAFEDSGADDDPSDDLVPPMRRMSVGAPGRAPPGASGPASNAVVKLFEDLQSGKLGDLAIPFPVLITAYRRRMLLNAHMAEDPTARRLGSSVLQALECSRREAALQQQDTGGGGNAAAARRSSVSSSPSSYLKHYVSTAEAASAVVESSSRGSTPNRELAPEGSRPRRRSSTANRGEPSSLVLAKDVSLLPTL
ncbi:hypothetical protein P43SY_007925 [Pythium insidiosum]|uniref:EF-hand domain-containing protein n=1 Tax=Pythium insidiosum TaxID=114742 RepID=A0AAD5LLB4_PYTIN|nr:hypothetical protein P43SY_007925 [Pythium insidiosum]